MCGISGIIATSEWTQQALMEAATAMAISLYHRGPDAQGVWVHPKYPLAFAHRRLSIQDLSPAGYQPMESASGRYNIVFNGEIYNFKFLSEKLRILGHRFRGHSDTEVLLAAMEEWGIEQALSCSRGMFALAVWDQETQELILARDRMGEKPLFFGWLKKCFVFASELKALDSVFHGSLFVDNKSLAAFFRFGYVPTPYSIYQNIFKLLPGTFLRIPVGKRPPVDNFCPLPGKASLSPTPYWQLETIAHQGVNNPILNDHEAIEQLDGLLRDTIKQQKIADVPIGAFLSGGVDSTLVAAIMQAVSDKPISTFTIGFREKEFDEAPYARAIAKYLRCDHHEYYVSADDGLDLIGMIPRYWDEPFADSSQIPALIISRIARQEVTVCLTGDGGDELFCGYNRHIFSDSFWLKQLKFPPWLRQLSSKGITSIPPHIWQSIYSLLISFRDKGKTQANVGLKLHKLAGLAKMDSMYEAYRYLMSYWHDVNNIIRHTKEATSNIDRQPNPALGHFIQDALYWDQTGYLVDDNLVKGDRASMAVSLETRLPLLDHRIVELSWRLPLSMKYRNGQSKWLLRQVLYRYVPKTMIERPKMGFSVPIGSWLRGPLKTWVSDLLHSNNISTTGNLDWPNIKILLGQHLKGSHDHSHKLWTICMWLVWLKEYHNVK